MELILGCFSLFVAPLWSLTFWPHKEKEPVIYSLSVYNGKPYHSSPPSKVSTVSTWKTSCSVRESESLSGPLGCSYLMPPPFCSLMWPKQQQKYKWKDKGKKTEEMWCFCCRHSLRTCFKKLPSILLLTRFLALLYTKLVSLCISYLPQFHLIPLNSKVEIGVWAEKRTLHCSLNLLVLNQEPLTSIAMGKITSSPQNVLRTTSI